MICKACRKAADEFKMIYHDSCRNFVNAGSNFCDCQHYLPGVCIILPVANDENFYKIGPNKIDTTGWETPDNA